MNKWLWLWGLVFAGAIQVAAQPFSLRKQVVAAAGGALAAADGRRLLGTLGEPVVGWTTSEAVGHGVGFWYDTGAQPVAVAEVGGQAWRASLHPNPASGAAWLEMMWDEGRFLRVELYNAGGQRVCELLSASYRSAGTHLISLSWGELPAGLYWVVLEGCDTAGQGCARQWLPLVIQP